MALIGKLRGNYYLKQGMLRTWARTAEVFPRVGEVLFAVGQQVRTWKQEIKLSSTGHLETVCQHKMVNHWEYQLRTQVLEVD